MKRSPRLIPLRRQPGRDHLAVVRAIWDDGDAVLPLPDDDGAATRLLAAVGPDEAPGGPGGRLPASAQRGLPPLPADAALVVATSGSSGAPRGVVLSHDAVRAAVQAGQARLGTYPADRWLCCLPLEHVAGLLVLLRGASVPGETIVQDGFDVAAISAALAGSHPPTLVSLVPTMLHRLLEAGVDVGAFRAILLGGAAADPVLLDRAVAAGATVVTSYGMTETCGGVVYDGVPLDGVGAAVDPDGRILLSGPTLLTGYRDDGNRPVTGGWFATNDHGQWDAQGRLRVNGRLDDVIVTGGENVSASALARALEGHPQVAAAAARGIPDADWGQRIEAWITGAGHDPPPLDDIIAFARSVLPAPAVPKRLHLVAELPRTGLGKVAGGGLEDVPVIASWPTRYN